ncbi:hypothetical protein BDN70DRAFT_872506 [Pholiota conissans]|uniref:DNA repair and recombination protein RAD54B n=1 Tax=Pholiota conissans TaxID=109636 RepID=A0A9P5ZBQ1_9AGAR|nr:hypothetical protein BDN70DRAFT_872506 [Pholiota conissans]
MPSFQTLACAQKRKLAEDDSDSSSRKRLSLGVPLSGSSGLDDSPDQIWMVQWRNHQYKKHKTWDGDAVLAVTAKGEATLYNCDGTIMGTNKIAKAFPLSENKNLTFGSKDIELEREIPHAQFLSGTCFGRNGGDVGAISTKAPTFQNKFNPPSFRRSEVAVAKGFSTANKASSSSTSNNTRLVPTNTGLSEITNQFCHWAANWRKPQGKKNKTWDGDAYISLVNHKLVMISEDGKIMGTTPWKGQPLVPGLVTHIAGKEVELNVAVSMSQLPETKSTEQTMLVEDPVQDIFDIPTLEIKQKPFIPPTSFYGKAAPRCKAKGPLHDPEAPEALVMKAPTNEHVKKFNRRNLAVVPVVIDPILSRKMRPHQKEGVSFLYECVMGLRKHEGQGCILADEMGLGKTLQTITLVWTLLRQNMYAAPLPVVQKVLIVCPVSLINNWKAEFHKWLGRDRVGIVTCDKNNTAIDLFGRSKSYEVLIIGYERLRTSIDKLANIFPPIGLIICDEGHRLKSANNKTAAMFKALDTRRRIILSGTPIQNDLGEFHAMAEFCNPGLLDDYIVFRKVYETPILKSRAPDASRKEIEVGEARTEQLLSVAKSFVLRRDTSLLKNHLPPKTELIVFVSPTTLQLEMFSKILNPSKLDDLIQKSNAESLALTTILRKISNSPILLKATADSVQGKTDVLSMQQLSVEEAVNFLPEKAHIADLTLSGKLLVLSKMLRILRQNTSEKCVLVSHFTSTLNILEAFCKKMSYSYFRLDGQTPQTKRQEYVDAFNKGNQHNGFIFLLSSKAGGVGINLIGGSRLFLIDPDWNPSHDLQSMARCHRDGQKRPVFIYRLLTAGAIDEKIYQRQVTKLALSESLIGSGSANSKSDSFTRKDLRDIFRIHPDTACNTHDLLECRCEEDIALGDELGSVIEEMECQEEMPVRIGFVCASDVETESYDPAEKAYLQKKKAGLASLSEWKHINCLKPSAVDLIQDDVLRRIVETSTEEGHTPVELGTDRNRSNVLLTGTDIDGIEAATKGHSTCRFPGGTVSFLFEKHSKTSLEDSIEE